jgi:hypothetical protein
MPRRTPPGPPSCEDCLRALGRYLDFTGLADISLAVRDDTIALTARRGRDPGPYPVQVNFSVPEIMALRNVAASQRGRGRTGVRRRPSRLLALQDGQDPSAPLSAWLEQERTLPYQELLRAIGRALDQRGVRAYELHETATDVILHIAEETSVAPEPHYLSKQRLRLHLDDGIRQRALRPADPLLPPRVPATPPSEAAGSAPAE